MKSTILVSIPLFLALSSSMLASEAPWSPRTPLSGPGAIGSPGGTHPVAIDGDTVHAVWTERGRIHYRRSSDAGATWGKPVAITSGGTAQYPCSLELAASCLHLIWPDRRDGSWEIYCKRSADGGVTWGPDTRLTHGVNLFLSAAQGNGARSQQGRFRVPPVSCEGRLTENFPAFSRTTP